MILSNKFQQTTSTTQNTQNVHLDEPEVGQDAVGAIAPLLMVRGLDLRSGDSLERNLIDKNKTTNNRQQTPTNKEEKKKSTAFSTRLTGFT